MARNKQITAGNQPWRKLPRYDLGIPRALDALFRQLKGWHEEEVRTAVSLQYLYERDKFKTRGGRFQMPRWVLEDYDWLDQTFASPTRNVVKSRVDMVTSLLFSSQPRLEIYAAGAGYEEQLIAESRAAALDGTINASGPREQRRRVARTGLIASFGACMPLARNNQVRFHAVDLDRLYWDPHDARSDAQGEPPREMHYVEFLDRDSLIAWYRGLDADMLGHAGREAKLGQLEQMTPTKRTRETDVQTPYDWLLAKRGITDATDRIRVVHSYRVASSPLLENGRYVCTAYDGGREHGIVLIDRDFTRSTLPICYWSPYPAETGGLIGVGLGAQLVDYQRAIDFSLGRGQQRLEKAGWHKVLLPGNVSQQVMDDLKAAEIAFVKIPQMEGPPVTMENRALSEHDITWIQMLVDWSAGDQGINEAIARGGSERGATASGVAMFEEKDRQLDRVSDIYEAWGLFSKQLGDETIGAIEDAIRFDKAFATHFKNPDGEAMLYDWADAALPTGQYVLELEEGSAFARTRPGRIARMVEGAKMGIFDPADVAAAVRESPDIRRLSRQSNALRRKILRDLTQLTNPRGKHGDVVVTEDDDLALAVKLTSERIADAQAAGAKPATVLRLREYRRDAESLLELLNAQAADPTQVTDPSAPPPGDPGLDPGAPMPAPAELQAALGLTS